MPQNKVWLLIASVLVISSLPLFARDKAKDYPWSRPIEGTGQASSPVYGEFYLDREIYNGAREDLADLRIVNSSGEFIPYLVETASVVTETDEAVWPTVMVESGQSKSDKPEADGRPYAVFQLAEEPTDGTEINILEVSMLNKISMDTWSVQVLVEGRSDDTSWTVLKQDSLYKLAQTEKGIITLDEPVSFNFFRITIQSGTRGVEPVSLTTRWNAFREESRPFVRTHDLKVLSRTEGVDNFTRLELDTPWKLPLSAITINGNGRYSRWCYLKDSGMIVYASGRILRWEDESGLINDGRIPFDSVLQSPEKLYLEIDNGSNKPIESITVTAEYLPARIVFEVIPGESYRLLFGNPEAEPPAYDLEAFRDTIAGKPRATLIPGTLEETLVINTGIKTEGFPWKMVLNLLLVVAGVGLTLLIVAALRQQNKNPGE
jgi:hypothetical protein